MESLQRANAAPQPLPEVGARHERTLEAVGCRRCSAPDWHVPSAWALPPSAPGFPRPARLPRLERAWPRAF